MLLLQRLAAASVVLAALSGTAAAEPIRMAVLKFGTVNWELSTIRRHGLDERHGFTLDVQELASNQATTVALQAGERSEEHTSELQSLMRNSYAVFCLKKKKTTHT